MGYEKKKIKQILPWVLMGIIFIFLFRQIPPKDVLKTILSANLPLFAFYAITYFFIVYFLDTLSLRFVLSRFSALVSFQETLIMRGATYLLMIINYNLGQGGMAFYLKKTHGAPVFKTLGAILYMTLIDLSLVICSSVVAVCFSNPIYHGIALRGFVLQAAGLFFIGFLLWLLFWKKVEQPAFKRIQKNRLVQWLLAHPLFYTFKEGTLRDLFWITILRAPMIFVITCSLYFWVDVFHGSLPWADIFAYGPILMLIMTLPITPAGLGTGQVFFIEFFSKSLGGLALQTGLLRPDELLLVASLLSTFANLLLKIMVGFYCLQKKSKALFLE